MDNERPIEKLLRRYAKKRREDAGTPPALHPATRRLLQGEVARRHPKNRSAGAALWARLKPRLIFAACMLALVATCAVLFLPTLARSKSRHLAAVRNPTSAPEERPMFRFDTNEATPGQMFSSAPLTSLEPDTPPLADTAMRSQGAAEVAMTALAKRPEMEIVSVTNGIPMAPTVAAASTPGRMSASGAISRGVVEGYTLSAGQPQAPEQAPGDMANFVSSNNLSQKFMNNVAVSEKDQSLLPVPTPVLNNFRWEQNGNQLRVIDADGSTYSGSVDATPVAFKADSVDRRKALSAFYDNTSVQTKQIYFFRVTGTNRTLNQSVVFSGNLSQTNGSGALGMEGDAVNQSQNTNQRPAIWLMNSTVVGKAQIGNGPEVNVTASPVNR